MWFLKNSVRFFFMKHGCQTRKSSLYFTSSCNCGSIINSLLLKVKISIFFWTILGSYLNSDKNRTNFTLCTPSENKKLTQKLEQYIFSSLRYFVDAILKGLLKNHKTRDCLNRSKLFFRNIIFLNKAVLSSP